MIRKLNGVRVAILVATGFEQIDLLESRRALAAAGAATEVVSPEPSQVWGWDFNDWGTSVDVDASLYNADPARYHSLLLPGGLMNADALRTNPSALDFIRAFATHGKPVATTGHGPWLLIDANVIHGPRLTSAPSLRRDLENAGARWIDAAVIRDQRLVSGRWPHDLPAFHKTMVASFAGARDLRLVRPA